jgi:hypothetical protein
MHFGSADGPSVLVGLRRFVLLSLPYEPVIGSPDRAPQTPFGASTAEVTHVTSTM